MVLQINLIKKKVSEIQEKRRFFWILQVSSIVVLIAFCVISLVVLSYSYFLKRKADGLDTKVAKAKTQLVNLQDKETKTVYLNKKLSSLSSVLKLQRVHQQQVETIFSLIPEGVSINDFNLGDEQLIALGGEAVDFTSLREFLDNISKASETTEGELSLDGAYVEAIDLDEEGSFIFQINIRLNGSKLKT